MEQKHKVVAIEWEDAEQGNNWEDIESSYKLAELTTIGMLLYEDSHVYVVASTADDKVCCGRVTVPKKLVLRFQEIGPN